MMVNNTRLLTTVLLWLFVITLSACGGGSSQTPTNSNSAQKQLSGISIEAAESSLTTNSEFQLKTIATYDDGSSEDVTANITWQVDDNHAASISPSGLLKTDKFLTSFSVTAQYNGLNASKSFELRPKKGALLRDIIFSNDIDFSLLNNQQEFVVQGNYTDGSVSEALLVVVKIDNPASNNGTEKVVRLVIDNNVYKPEAVSGGTAMLTAAATLVSINLSLSNGSVVSGNSITATVSGLYDDGSTVSSFANVGWQTTGPVTIDSNGVITANSVSADTPASVTATVSGLTATQSFTVSPAPVTATDPVLQSLNIIVTSSTNLNPGESINLSVSGLYSDGSEKNLTNTAVWSSSNTAIATANSNGTVTAGNTPGTATITATVGTLQNSISVTSLPTLNSIALNASKNVLAPGESITLSVLGTYSDNSQKPVTAILNWSSSDNSIVAVNAVSGTIVGGNTEGTATITASINGLSATIDIALLKPVTLDFISINSPSSSIAANQTIQLTAMATFSNGDVMDYSNQVIWNSDNPAVISVDGNGLAQAFGNVASTLIKVSFNGQVWSRSFSVTPPANASIQSIAIAPFSEQLAANQSVPMRVLANYGNNITEDITSQISWSSSDETIALVDAQNNLITKQTIGSTTITASHSQSGLSDQKIVSVVNDNNAKVKEIKFDDAYITLLTGKSYTPKLKLIYLNGIESTVSQGVVWSSTNESVATVDSNGTITSQNISNSNGNAQILAQYTDGSGTVFEKAVYVFVSQQGVADEFMFQINGQAEQSWIESVFAMPKPELKSFHNLSGLLTDIPVKTPFPGYFITATSGVTAQQFALAINSTSPGDYDKTNASMSFVLDKGTDEFFTLDNTADTSLSIVISSYELVGGKTTGSFTATLCKNTAIDNAQCQLPENRISVSGMFAVTIENEMPFTCFSSSQPEKITSYTAHSFQQVCSGIDKSYYAIDSIPGIQYQIKTTSTGANVAIQAFSGSNTTPEVETVVGDERSVLITAGVGTTIFSVDYIGSGPGSTFFLDVTPQAIGNTGTLNNPTLINDNIMPLTDILTVNNNTSYYKLPVTAGHLYKLTYKIESQTGAASVVSVSNDNSFDASKVCGGNLCPNIRAMGNFIFVKLDATAGGSATISVTLEYQSDRDPNNYQEFLGLSLPVVAHKGQAGGPDIPYIGPQGSLYWISGLQANTTYLVKVSGVDLLTRMWINEYQNAQILENPDTSSQTICDAIGDENTSEFFCVIKTTANVVANSGFAVNLIAQGSAGTRYTLDIFNITDEVYYVSTFANKKTNLTSGYTIAELALYRLNETKPFLITATDSNIFTSKAFYMAPGETVNIQVTDPNRIADYYSIIVKNTGGIPFTAPDRPGYPDDFEINGDNIRDNATQLLLDQASHHSLINADGSVGDIDWFYFTAP